MKILKIGKKIKKTDNYIHKCEECKTKFIYNIKDDTEINGICDTRLVVKCPNCNNYDIIESCFGIMDKNIIKKED